MEASLLFGVVLLATSLYGTNGWRVELPHARVENGVRVSYEPYEETWTAFKNTYGRSYNTSEDRFRYGLFLERLKVIEEHNRKYTVGETTYSMDISSFSDLTNDERASRTMCRSHKSSRSKRSSGFCIPYSRGSGSIPSHKDWRSDGCVARVRDQGTSCGSCYAFAVASTIESQLCRQTGKLTELSVQQIVDCCGFGCRGVDYGSDVFKCLANQGGLMADKDYGRPYIAQERDCLFEKGRQAANVTGCRAVVSETDMRYAVAFDGPLYGEVQVPDDDFENMLDFHNGVYRCSGCRSSADHCITIIGFGKQNGLKYWLLKNSWGDDNHYGGYLKIERGADSCCIESSDTFLPGCAVFLTPQRGPLLAYILLSVLFTLVC